jgi:hypothetical protein
MALGRVLETLLADASLGKGSAPFHKRRHDELHTLEPRRPPNQAGPVRDG